MKKGPIKKGLNNPVYLLNHFNRVQTNNPDYLLNRFNRVQTYPVYLLKSF